MRGAASGGFESHTHFVCPVRSQEYRARLLLLPLIQTCRGSLSDMTPKGTVIPTHIPLMRRAGGAGWCSG